ncbi:DMT family transporter [Coprobacter tertius]|uniref:DMT family transporter n=1 Tax=Coprobacter tertius TaxID=2944915 RepID=A0ABT1MEQ5_9BACT|nr:DMT family transporter [Coprobacter tertius]MCP9610861.1 DMT family transporter [Coprobacter tertius]
MANLKGFLAGIISSSTFGLIPLFTLPLMAQGMDFDSILFYRFLIAGISIGIVLPLKKISFRISKAELLTLSYLSIFYVVSAMFLFWGYNYLPSGIATTIHFLYPVFVTLIMFLYYHERLSVIIITAIIMAFFGVAFLSIGGAAEKIDMAGIGIVLISAIGYALYIIKVSKSKVRNMNGSKLTFYVLLIGALIFYIQTLIKGTFQIIPNTQSLINILLLAILPTVISNLALVYAIKRIGSTLTAVLGAMEPLTALCVGILVFGEPITSRIATGFLLIISAVSLIILSRPLEKIIRQLFFRLRQ